MTQIFARSALVLFATTAIGVCAGPTYAENAAPAGQHAAVRTDRGLLAPAVYRGEPPLLERVAHRRRRAAPEPAATDVPGSYSVRRGDTLGKISARFHVSIDDLMSANGLTNSALQVGQVLTIPGLGEEPKGRTPESADAATYEVTSGDTLGKISGRFGVSIADLKRANGLRSSALRVGQVLTIPGVGERSTGRKPAVATTEPANPATYEVRSGDTLGKISARFGVSIADLKRANGLRSSALQVGQVLTVPGSPATSDDRHGPAPGTEPTRPKTYEVKRGDTLFSIARRFEVDLDELRAANGIGEGGAIRVGQTLKLTAADDASQRIVLTPSRDAGDRGPAAGRVIDVEGTPVTYKVRKGDTLEKIAAKLDTDIATLRRDNRIRGSRIFPGQVLKGPRTSSKAYVVRSGDGLEDIARRFGVTADRLRAANGLRRGASLRAGQQLVLPAGYRDRGASGAALQTETPESQTGRSATRPQYSSGDEPSPTHQAQPAPYTGPIPRPYIPPPGGGPPLAPQPAAPLTDAQITELSRGRFLWPLQGEIVSDFGPKTVGQRNDGINIRANTGDPVRAAAAGDVVYAGDQLPDFGNLVLIKHADGWVTAYGHLSRVEVKMQQKIIQGQEIGEAGSSGNVTEPQVHFEVRYAPSPLDRARPVDPKLVLPK